MEPIYQYIKGQGWVACVDRRVKVKLVDGTEVWFIDRKPVPGERHLNRNLWNRPNYGTYEHANLEYFAQHEVHYSIDNYSVRKSSTYDPDFTYIVVEPCE